MTYSSSMSMNRKRYASRHQNAVSMSEQVRTIGPVSNTIMLIILSCLLGLLYLTQITKTNSLGYQIDGVNGLQNHYSELQKEHANLELSAARLQSLDRVATSPAAERLVTVAPTATLQ